MLVFSGFRAFLVCLTCFLGLLFSCPSFLSTDKLSKLPSWMQHTINLGLELRGGSYLQLEVDLKTVEKEYLQGLIDDVRSSLRKENIGYIGLSVDAYKENPSLKFTLRDQASLEKVKSIIKSIDSTLSVNSLNDEVQITLSKENLQERNKKIIEQSIEVIRRRVDESGTKEPIIQRQGNDRIILQLPGIENPSEVKALIGKTAKMTFHFVDENAPSIHAKSKDELIKEKAPMGSSYMPCVHRSGVVEFLAVKNQVMLSGEHLIDAHISYDHSGMPAVGLKFNSIGTKKFAQMSSNVGKIFAIVLDGEIITAPRFSEPILTGSGQITGSFSVKEAHDLSLLLRAGSLPAPLKVVEERTIGPSLGLDSIHHGQIATLIAFALVCTFMLMAYKVFGIFSAIALFFNLSLLFAGLSILQSTLTLPGIAGIALTIGMAVDANVLIYERIKEEIRSGAKPVAAIQAGYKRALTTILDSNITTLIGAAVLFEFGTGPIRGFAVTLALGILISLFTALSLTRLLIATWLKGRRIEKLSI